MKCDKCGQNEASLHMVKIENGFTSESNLCASCAAQSGMFAGPFSLKDIFTSFIPPQIQQSVCGTCGTTLSDIRRTGFAGCENCYRDLRDELLPMLKSLHGSTNHVGATPNGWEKPTYQEDELAKLRKLLNAAVAEERYEEAAQLRDRMHAVEKARGGQQNV